MKIKWKDLCSMHAKHQHLSFILPLTQFLVSQAFMQMLPFYLKSACFGQKCYCPYIIYITCEKLEVFIRDRYALSASLGPGAIHLLFPFPKWAIGDWHRYLHDKRRITSGSLSQVGHIIWSTHCLSLCFIDLCSIESEPWCV